MKYSVMAQIFTGIAFGLSIVLWAFMPSVPILPSIEGAPLYAIHPLFMFQLFFMLSALIVWFMMFLLSFRYVLRRIKTLTVIVKRDWFAFLLAFIAVVGALSGCIFYSENMQREEFGIVDGLQDMPGLTPPNPFLSINVVTLILYEILWIINIRARSIGLRFH